MTSLTTAMTEQQAADYLGVSLSTLARERRRGEGPPHRKVGHQVRYHPGSLEDWLRAEKTDSERGRRPSRDLALPVQAKGAAKGSRVYRLGGRASKPRRRSASNERAQATGDPRATGARGGDIVQ